MTPFDTETAKQHITDLTHNYVRPFEYINEYVFLSVTKEYTDKDIKEMKKTLKKYSALSDEDIEEVMHNNDIDSEIGFEILTSAYLLDDVLGGNDYSADCIGYSDEYRLAAEMLRQDISKKRFLSKKSFYDLSEILRNAVDALDYVLGIGCDSELAEKMKTNGAYEKWKEKIMDLQNRLSSHIEYKQL